MNNENHPSQPLDNHEPGAVSHELHQDPDLWLSDGNIVLTAKDDDGRLWGFRCHKSLLSKHSAVFSDMLNLDQPVDAEMYEGLPLAALPDSYADVRALLQMLFDPVNFLPKPSKTPQLCYQSELTAVSGPLRLSHKYEFVALHTNLVKVLEAQWPLTLEEWTTVAEHMGPLYLLSRLQFVDEPLVNPASVILLAEEAGVPSVLPAAWYNLHIVSGHNNNLILSSATVREFKAAEKLGDRDLENLPSGHHVRLNKGSRYLRSAALQMLTDGLPAKFSCSQTECKEDTNKWLREQFDAYSASERLSYDPLHVFRELCKSVAELPLYEDSEELGYRICWHCRSKLIDSTQAWRRYLWDQIPYFFGVEAMVEGKDYGYAQYIDEI